MSRLSLCPCLVCCSLFSQATEESSDRGAERTLEPKESEDVSEVDDVQKFGTEAA